MRWVDITGPANWSPDYLYLYDMFGTSCIISISLPFFSYLGIPALTGDDGVYEIGGGGDRKYVFTGGQWVPPHPWAPEAETSEVCSAGSGGFNGSFPCLKYVGATDVSEATDLRLTVIMADNITINETSTSANGIRNGFDITPGAYTAGTQFIITGTGSPINLATTGTVSDALQYLVAAMNEPSGDNSTPATVIPFIIAKIEVLVPGGFWTDLVGTEEIG